MTNFFPPGDQPNQNFDKLNQFLNTLFGGKSPRVRWGTATATGAGTPNKTITQSHGLGTQAVAAFAIAEPSTKNCGTNTLTGTQFNIDIRDVDNAAWSTTITLYWFAIG